MKRKQPPRVRVAPAVYRQGPHYFHGYQADGTDKDGRPKRVWRVERLHDTAGDPVTTITEAKKARRRVLAGLDEGRIAARNSATFADAFAEHQAARDISPRTRDHERHLVDRHLSGLKERPVQSITPSNVAAVLRGMRDGGLSPWTRSAVYRLLCGTFGIALRRGTLTRSPMDGLADSERPRQKNAKRIAVLDPESMERLIAAGSTERWRAAIALAGIAGLRLGEVRGLCWEDIDLDANTISIERSLLPDGTPKATKSEAGRRTVPMLPALRRRLVEWKVRSPRTDGYVICSYDGQPVQERNLRRALTAAKEAAGLDGGEERLSWHSLRHSFASTLATDLELPATTLARIVGHADAGFSLRVYARDARDEAAVVSDVLARAASAQIGG